jgi:hypothetical protein
MDMLMALAVSIGVLIALWVKFGGAIAAFAVPAGIVAWACFFAAGGKTTGLQKTIASTLSGVVWVWLAMTLIGAMGMGSFTWVIVGVVAFLLVMQSRVAILSFIPGAFCGAAVTAWATPTDAKGYLMVAVALVAGAVLGYLSEMGAGMIAKKA